ncbi:unnamed protein product [Callosobruchus maculatus]|nr:unnamed protein product [Callosobruchus maculatus]
MNVKQYVTYKSCYPTMDRKECDVFWKTMKDTSPMTAKLKPIYDCYVCKDNDCNRDRYMSGASRLDVPIILLGTFSIILAKIVL